jgi:SpoVK/Ycf46/Vps4 family AAA+-type ATPase
MATNFQDDFDEAIKRPGRFDLLLCMGPPSLQAKCDNLHKFVELRESTDETTAAAEAILSFCASDADLRDRLTLFTYSEFKYLLTNLCSSGGLNNVGSILTGLGEKEVAIRVRRQHVGLDLTEIKPKLQELGLTSLADLEATENDLQNLGPGPLARYLRDRRASRLQ